uniref:Uncharacterized protein n=1 Tax=Globisporangium ultimum (strain ATCC 200006 / CBS 805.95 / DAOM BR144) TaxID=431595 RepID=K3WS18_GLOUD
MWALPQPASRRSAFGVRASREACRAGPEECADDAGASETRRRRRRNRSKNCKTLRPNSKRGPRALSAQQQWALTRRQQDGESTSLESSSLESDSQLLLRQIEEINRRLSLLDSVTLVSRQNAYGAALQMMQMYHQFTCRGYMPANNVEHGEQATQFLRSVFAEDLRCPDFTGLTVFLQQWESLSLYHASLMVEPKGLEILPTKTVALSTWRGRYRDDAFLIKSFGTTTLRISRTTIECVFPHILLDEPLVQWLIGKEYSFSYTMIAHINSEGRIFQLESCVDLTSALLNLLHDPFVTVKMIEATKMTKGGNLLVQHEVREAQNVIENGFL